MHKGRTERSPRAPYIYAIQLTNCQVNGICGIICKYFNSSLEINLDLALQTDGWKYVTEAAIHSVAGYTICIILEAQGMRGKVLMRSAALSLCAAVLFCGTAFAVPALEQSRQMEQPDGSMRAGLR